MRKLGTLIMVFALSNLAFFGYRYIWFDIALTTEQVLSLATLTAFFLAVGGALFVSSTPRK